MSDPNEELKKWRLGLGLSQTDAGKMLTPNVTQSAWAAWEAGKKPPSLQSAFEIQRVTAGLIVASSWTLPGVVERRKALAQARLQPMAKAS